ncbi:uncharacterized protein TRIADDRAFT_62185 [Trichoplax adhaerens]|uniref:Uncharacterized protein n=1 Tax=Trichoplax adhaerens TaxID=10228 RepID=B3SD29_TRIAD|nr:predicted protein [Trichoplax adhaerens]EDV19366.1 predicted protein [Trichoplax adhaerens]|eukprot:XP_002118141.1 predicted protein [Trichoplax adhaerens]
MAGSSVSIPHHEDLIVSRQIQRLAVYFGICQLLSGIVYVICSIIAISQFHDEAIPPVNYGVNFISGLMFCLTGILSVICLYQPELQYSCSEIANMVVNRQTQSNKGAVGLTFCLSTILVHFIEIMKDVA